MKGRICAAVAFALVASTGWAAAAELKVFSTIGVQAALEELTPKFEQASGHKLVITWNTAAVLVKRLQAGETADVVVLTRQSLDTLSKEGKAAAEPTFASSGITPMRSKISWDRGWIPLPREPPNGSGAASSTRTSTPRLASSIASVRPVGPPPTTTTRPYSYDIRITMTVHCTKCKRVHGSGGHTRQRRAGLPNRCGRAKRTAKQSPTPTRWSAPTATPP